jgi:hypothetical protein
MGIYFNMELETGKSRTNNKIQFLFIVLFLMIGSSCTQIKVGIELLLSDLDGDKLIENEKQVRNTLETILFSAENYTLTGYTRRIFSPEVKKTQSHYHSFYLITSDDVLFITLSFSGTKKRMQSEGAWAINTKSDMKSYISFKYGTNEWEVQEILLNKGINTEMTIKNILYRIDNNISYYYNDHINNVEGMENCNTALRNTLVENN